jgi:hypothetical protein
VSEYDSLIEGYPGLDDPRNDPGPLTEAEGKTLMEVFAPDEPPVEPDDWPEEEQEVTLGIPVLVAPQGESELRLLRPDQVPLVGSHYVVFGGVPRPVLRGNYAVSEDEHVREHLLVPDDLRDIDGQRQARADRTIRQRYRGYLCGEMSSL